jgi:Domain of unknown function (DUF4412)
MKRIFAIAGIALTAAVVRADLVMDQKVESATVNGNIITKIKGNKVRMDMPTTAQGNTSTIMDVNTGNSIMLMHGQKALITIPGAAIRQMAENMKKKRASGAVTNAELPKFHDTGKTGKAANYDAEIYTWSSPNGAIQTVWVAKNFPNYSKIKGQMDKLNNSPVAQMSKEMSPDIGSLPGMVVKTQVELKGQKVTSTLVSIKEESVAAAVFEAPKDYHEMVQPVMSKQPPSGTTSRNQLPPKK